MNIGFVVGELGRGGAELQLLQLARGLLARGHQVFVVSYGGSGVLDDAFRSLGAGVHVERATRSVDKLRLIGAWMRSTDLDIVHAILWRASAYAILARGMRHQPPVIATDYSTATYGGWSAAFAFSLVLFAGSDAVVTEVEVNRRSLERRAPWLRGKVHVIRNALDADRFSPGLSNTDVDRERFVFGCVGTLSDVKNPGRVVDAVEELVNRGHAEFRLDWYGRDSLDPRRNVGPSVRAAVEERGLSEHIVFHGDVEDIEHAYRRCDALVHASLVEGFPNAVAEAMACGLPVLVSGVSDLPRVVDEAHNGYVFDAADAHSIADAMERMMHLDVVERRAMARRSRALAVRWFDSRRFVDDVEELYFARIRAQKRVE